MKFKLTTAAILVALVIALAPIAVAQAQPMLGPQLPAVVITAPPVQAPADEALTEAQLILVGIVASAALWALRLAASRGYQPTKEVVAIALYVVAFVMALLFKSATLPPFPPFSDAPTFVTALLTYAGALLTLAAPIAGLAYLIYNVFLQKILEGLRTRAKKVLHA